MSTENRRKFAIALAKMVSPLETETAAQALLAMLPALNDIPEDAFATPGNLAAELGKGFTRCPSLAQLHKALAAWWEAHKPASELLLPGATGMDEKARIYASLWEKDRAAGWSHLSGSADERMAVSLGKTRELCLPAFRYICDTDGNAWRIAAERGWLPKREEPPAEFTGATIAARLIEIEKLQDERGLIATTAARSQLALLRIAVTRHAPQLQHLVPERIGPDPEPDILPPARPAPPPAPPEPPPVTINGAPVPPPANDTSRLPDDLWGLGEGA
jgi:hypothetical protein